MSVPGLLTLNTTLAIGLSLGLVGFTSGHPVLLSKDGISQRQRGVHFSEWPECAQPCREHGLQGRRHEFQTLTLPSTAEGEVGEQDAAEEGTSTCFCRGRAGGQGAVRWSTLPLHPGPPLEGGPGASEFWQGRGLRLLPCGRGAHPWARGPPDRDFRVRSPSPPRLAIWTEARPFCWGIGHREERVTAWASAASYANSLGGTSPE